MGDEKEGPFKVVASLSRHRLDATKYSIVEQQKNDVFQREIVPDAGSGETARHLCNLLNKHHKMLQENEAALTKEILNDLRD